ncbi:MAG: GxxExxY protein [Pedosphaera sp. Tous-C6FEB]|nr:MAG: GxxExxY protein [Pedosphaera sp. Tous-C6FEB]
MSTSTKDPIFLLCDTVRETSFALQKYLRHGHVEKVYQNGWLHRLRKLGLIAEAEVPLQVRDEDGTVLGDFFADLLVQKGLLVELKAVKQLTDEHVAQVLGYMRASGIEHALLINFGSARLEIRKFVLNDAFRVESAATPKPKSFLSLLFAPLCASLWQ